jgi:hypothetical protein
MSSAYKDPQKEDYYVDWCTDLADGAPPAPALKIVDYTEMYFSFGGTTTKGLQRGTLDKYMFK